MNDLPFQETLPGTQYTKLKSFYGKPTDQIPRLLHGTDDTGNVIDLPRLPMTPKQLIAGRVYGPEHDRDLLISTSMVTACGVFYDPRLTGEVKVAHYTHPLVMEMINHLNPQSKLLNTIPKDPSCGFAQGLAITQEVYDAITGNVFVITPNDANELCRIPLSCQIVREDLLEYLVEGDTDVSKDYRLLLKEYILDELSGSMGFHLMDAIPEIAGMFLLSIARVNLMDSSDVYGHTLGGPFSNYLVGIASDGRK
ncbi:hypothetical protein HZB02_04545 [Candidatus Woesearchaeota archaeon]|nr:hypothetical protein [Candidatus Woesearchaeota archaeon]